MDVVAYKVVVHVLLKKSFLNAKVRRCAINVIRSLGKDNIPVECCDGAVEERKVERRRSKRSSSSSSSGGSAAALVPHHHRAAAGAYGIWLATNNNNIGVAYGKKKNKEHHRTEHVTCHCFLSLSKNKEEE